MLVPGRGRREERAFTLAGAAADRSVLGAIAAAGGRYETATLRALRRALPPDAVVLDIGANIGAFSLAFAALCPAGTVHAFEPGGLSHGYLARNVAANGPVDVRPHRLALSDRTGELTFHCDAADPGAAHLAAAGEGGETVPVTTLDAWAAGAGLPRVDLVKLDVEGNETAVLRGAREILARHRPAVLVEVNPVTLARFGHTTLPAFFAEVHRLWPRLLYLVRGGIPAEVRSLGTLRALLRQRGVFNLLGTGRIPPPRWVASPARLLLAAESRMRDALRRRSGRTFVIEPACAIGLPSPAASAQPGGRLEVAVALRNDGREVLSSRPARHPTHLAYRVFDSGGGLVVADGVRTALPRDLRPGEGAGALLTVVAPQRPGDYRVRVSLVQEGWAWFDDLSPDHGRDLALAVA
jgi:FkbM family methyltransferase